MHVVGIRELKQNASAVVADAAAGETVVISDRGRMVARMTPLPRSFWEAALASGIARDPVLPTTDVAYPTHGGSLSKALEDDRGDARY